jgi:hypothetical protein
LDLQLAVTSGKEISLRLSGNKNRLAVSGNAVTNFRSFANAVRKAVIKIPHMWHLEASKEHSLVWTALLSLFLVRTHRTAMMMMMAAMTLTS